MGYPLVGSKGARVADEGSAGAQFASKLASGLGSKIGAELGGLIVNQLVIAIFGPDGPPSYFTEVYAEISKIIKDELTKNDTELNDNELKTHIQWMAINYKNSKDAGRPDWEKLKEHEDHMEGVVALLMRDRFKELGFGAFLSAAGVHLSMLLELAKLARAKTIDDEGYEKDILDYAGKYRAHVAEVWSALVAKRRAAIHLDHEGRRGTTSSYWHLVDDVDPTKNLSWHENDGPNAEAEANEALNERLNEKEIGLAVSLGFPDDIYDNFLSVSQNPLNPERHVARARPGKTGVTKVDTDGFLLGNFEVRDPVYGRDRRKTKANTWAVVYSSGNPPNHAVSGTTLSYDVDSNLYYDHGSFFCPVVKDDAYNISTGNEWGEIRTRLKWQPFEGLGLGGWETIPTEEWHRKEQDGFAVVHLMAKGGSRKAFGTIAAVQRPRDKNKDSDGELYVQAMMQHGSDWPGGGFVQMWSQSFCMPVAKGYDFWLTGQGFGQTLDLEHLAAFWIPINGPYRFKAPVQVTPLFKDVPAQHAENDGIFFGYVETGSSGASGHCLLLAGDSDWHMWYKPSAYATAAVHFHNGRLVYRNSASIFVRKGQSYCAQLKGPPQLSGTFHFTEIVPT